MQNFTKFTPELNESIIASLTRCSAVAKGRAILCVVENVGVTQVIQDDSNLHTVE